MKTIVRLLVLALMLFASAKAFGANAAVQSPKVSVRLLNKADLKPETLTKIEKSAETLMSEAGIEISWYVPEDLTAPARTDVLYIYLVSEVNQACRGKLADRLGCTTLNGKIGYVDAGVAASNEVASGQPNCGVIFGRVISHELAHMLGVPDSRGNHLVMAGGDVWVSTTYGVAWDKKEIEQMRKRLAEIPQVASR